MPVFELTYPEGALAPEAREKLLEDLTAALLRAERAPDTEFFRSVTWSYVHELPEGSVLAGRAAGLGADLQDRRHHARRGRSRIAAAASSSRRRPRRSARPPASGPRTPCASGC